MHKLTDVARSNDVFTVDLEQPVAGAIRTVRPRQALDARVENGNFVHPSQKFAWRRSSGERIAIDAEPPVMPDTVAFASDLFAATRDGA